MGAQLSRRDYSFSGYTFDRVRLPDETMLIYVYDGGILRIQDHFSHLRHVLSNVGRIRTLEAQCEKLEAQVEEAKYTLPQMRSPTTYEAKYTLPQMRSPTTYKKLKKETFETFLSNIRQLNFQQAIPRKNRNERHHVLIGNISVGKSSLINKVCGTNLKVGVGETTTAAREVASNGDCHIWDSPGHNDDFTFCDIKTLTFFYSCDKIFILYDSSLKTCLQMVRVLHVIKPYATFLVRTKCDTFTAQMDKTIDHQLQVDRKFLASNNIKLPVFATSSKKSATFLDNAKVYQMIKQK